MKNVNEALKVEVEVWVEKELEGEGMQNEVKLVEIGKRVEVDDEKERCRLRIEWWEGRRRRCRMRMKWWR